MLLQPLKIFVSSSWRNTLQPEVVQALRDEGHEVYDFKENKAFNWAEIDTNWKAWDSDGVREGLEHSLAKEAFESDFYALDDCDVCVMVQPCGQSSALELGWAVGSGKHTVVLLCEDSGPELMLKMADLLVTDLQELLLWLGTVEPEDEYVGGLSHDQLYE